MRRLIWLVAVLVAGAPMMARAQSTGPMSCGTNDPLLMKHDYARAAGDVFTANHMEFVRPFAMDGEMKVNVCNGDLRVRTLKDGTEARLSVDVADGGGRAMLEYIDTIQVTPEHGVINLKFPKGVQGTVTLWMPMGAGSHDEFNLGKGDMDFNAAGAAGHREMNVGMGKMTLHVDGDKSYSTMEVNVGLGAMHDERPGGRSGHFTVTKTFSGTGEGSIEANVGMGSMEIESD
ncbi:MAG: hypothetical protein WBY53_11245 [Acidobacteriaceae bacterium]